MIRLILIILRLSLVAFTIVAAIAEVIALFSPAVRPEGISPFAILTMIEPLLIAANVLSAIMWIVMWKPWAFLPLVVVMLSMGRVDSYYSYRIGRDLSEMQNEKPVKKKMRFMSYNVKGFKNSADTMDSVLSTIQSFDPDVLCLVEFSALSGVEDKFSSTLPKLKYHVSDKGVKGSISKDHGIVIMSRYPLVNPSKYEYDGRGIAVTADAVIFYGDTLRLVGLHLESTNYNAISKERELETYMADSTIDTKGVIGSIRNDSTRSILASRSVVLLQTLSEHSYHRSFQADTVRSKFVDSAQHPVVMGDFNDTPYSYSVRTVQGDNLTDPFTTIPRNEYGYTFNLLHKLFRIDYILFDKNSFEVLDYSSPDLPFSDHNPVMVTVRRSY